jgi:hypothetical protein
MKTKKQPFDYDHHDLAGHASIDFAGRNDFSSFAERITGYNPERFSPVALRMFVQKGQPILTLYALDKSKEAARGKIAVKKFKLRLAMHEILSMIKRFDFTVSDGKYDIRDIVVTNK